jgi:hypothetical protein
MSDAPAGWTELLVAPLGEEPTEDTSFARLLCLRSRQDLSPPLDPRRNPDAEP